LFGKEEHGRPMRFLVGCSSIIALVVFIIGFVVSLFNADATWTDRLAMAGLESIDGLTQAIRKALDDFDEITKTDDQIES
jgi:hypothetical protein